MERNRQRHIMDLNDMHEAEKTLTPDQFRSYARHLYSIVDDGGDGMIRATAIQKSEAYLKAKGLLP